MKFKKNIVDVRTSEEYMEGHTEGSVNIPLHQIPQRTEEIRNLEKPVILCSARGNRSARAEFILRSQGIDCINAGSWTDVDLFLEARDY